MYRFCIDFLNITQYYLTKHKATIINTARLLLNSFQICRIILLASVVWDSEEILPNKIKEGNIKIVNFVVVGIKILCLSLILRINVVSSLFVQNQSVLKQNTVFVENFGKMEEMRSKHKSIQSTAHHIALECIHPQVGHLFGFLIVYLTSR